MLYQKGEKLKELQQTIKDIPTLSGLSTTDFVMSKKALKSFEIPILKLFNTLNTFLFNTLISKKSEEDKRKDVYDAVENIVSFLEERYDKDLREYFYEEKLELYEKMFIILVRNELYKRFPEYKDILSAIPNAYREHQKKSETKFPEISRLINIHIEISEDRENGVYDSTAMYLDHSIEMIYEEISELIKNQCTMKFLNPDVLPNSLRQLIYLLKSELPIIFEKNEDEE